METNHTLKKAGLAALILLAPGGFILGATLAARHWRKRQAEKVDSVDIASDAPCALRVEGGDSAASDSGKTSGGAVGEAT